MQLTFRWYDEQDTISLEYIRQIPGVTGVVSAVRNVPVGQAWPEERLVTLKRRAEENALSFNVIESIPVHEEIKYGGKNRDKYVEAWIESMTSVAHVLGEGSIITYNFMPVFDWTRSSLYSENVDGSTSLAFDKDTIDKMDPLDGELELPGWLATYTKEQLTKLMKIFQETDDDHVYRNLVSFLKDVCPVAEKLGVKLAIHPDDPPWSLFGIPRVVTGADSFRRMFKDVPSPSNGICLCTGSLASNPDNNVVDIIDEFHERINFVHLRNVKCDGAGSFRETAHPSRYGSLDMAEIVRHLVKGNFNGPIRPDHGRMIWNEKGKPGYGLFDRALGASYILGLFDAIEK